jgi:predicted RNA-binding protein with EMAP domain
MLELEVLVREVAAIDGGAAGTVVVGEVATLNHELRDNLCVCVYVCMCVYM